MLLLLLILERPQRAEMTTILLICPKTPRKQSTRFFLKSSARGGSHG